MSEYFDLGRYTRVVTSIPEAQVWFDRGLVWLFAYNHEEAIVCFEKAVAADPGMIRLALVLPLIPTRLLSFLN